jgi:hypothetical protein
VLVIGVVPDVRDRLLGDEGLATMYLPITTSRPAAYILVRTRGEAGAMVPAVRTPIEQHGSIARCRWQCDRQIARSPDHPTVPIALPGRVEARSRWKN